MKSIALLALSTLLYTTAYTQEIVVLSEHNSADINSAPIDEIKFKDKGFKMHCTYKDALNYLKQKATEKDANLIKITQHKYPDQRSTCHRISAELYKVDNPEQYEKDIIWTEDRKLKWSDFKADKSPYPGNTVIATSYCQLGFTGGAHGAFSKAKFTVLATFQKNLSWAIDDKTELTPEGLHYQQLRFDLCEVYARKLYKELVDRKLTPYNIAEANNVYQQVFDEYNNRQMKMDTDTQSGYLENEIKVWSKDIAAELIALEAYANHY